MRYLLIDNDGDLHVKDAAWSEIRAEVGPEGPSGVTIPPHYGWPDTWLRGWVNDVGLLKPETYPRNVVGSLVLTGCGAALHPYPGPVVITGFDQRTRDVCDLDDELIRTVTEIHADARAAVAGEPGPLYDNAREIAEHVRTCPTPGIRILSADDLFRERA